VSKIKRLVKDSTISVGGKSNHGEVRNAKQGRKAEPSQDLKKKKTSV